ncbi:MAG: hypothetical protein KDK60_00345, partial [Chlamydiia bacterium]|nr:hypothetical protein [Chlamydiia bacterium]
MNRIRRIFILFFILFFVLLSGSLASFFFFSKGGNGIVVGGKDTEGHVLGEIMAQLIEESLSLPVRRQYNLEGTLIHFQAIQACQIDLYIEYSGTAALTIFQGRIEGKSRRAHTQNLQKAFLEEFGLVYLPALGFQNTYALMMEERVAKEKGIETLSDFAAKLKEGETFSIAFDAEFYGRAERQALEEGYQIDLRGFPLMDHTLLYLTLKKGGVEVING